MNDAPDPTLLAALTKLNEGQWVELLARVGEPGQGPPAERDAFEARAESLASRAARDPRLRAQLDAFLGASSRLDLVLVVVQREFPDLPARIESALLRLRGLALNIRHIDPTKDTLPNAELTIVVLGAAVGKAEVFETALGDPAACIGLLLDPLTLDQSLQYAEDAVPRLRLASHYKARFHRFTADPVAALDEPLSDWLTRYRPDAGGLLRPFERAYLKAREPEWESGSMRHLSGLVRLPSRDSEQRALNREAMYVSLHAGPGHWGRDRAGKAALTDRQARQEPREREPEAPLFLDELLSLPALPQALVEGEAGSGKTVLLQHLGLSLARVLLRKAPPAESRLTLESPPIPVALEAASLHPGGCADVVRCFADHLARLLGAAEDLSNDLLQGRYWLLIDALDEVPGEAKRKELLDALASLARQAPKLRLTLTSRPGAHTGLSVPAPLRVVPVAPLDEDRRGALIARWGQGQGFTPAQIDDARDKISSLEDRFPEDQEGRSPLTNPLLCTAALLVYWQEWQLPNNLADLYQRLIAALCRCRVGPGESAESFQRGLVRVARALQDAGGTRLGLRKAASALDPADPLAAEERIHRLVNATGVLRTESTNRGVVVRPWHRSFQEYLAAASLLDTAGSVDATVDFLRQPRGRSPSRLHDPFWTGTLRMAVGVFGVGAPTRAQALVDAWLREAEREEKESSPAARRREGHLLALAASGVREYRDESFEDSALLETLPALLARRYEAGGVDWAWRDRVDGLDALGALGDPRLPEPRESLEGWVYVEVEAGEVEIGGDSQDEALYSPLRKQRFRHGALWVRRHPVTVKEYAGFLRAADPKHIPQEWGRQSLYDTRPVVNVGWHDARAFCAWAQRAWKLPGAGVLDLPTSREWEAVALGDRGGPYPWGDKEAGAGDASRAAYDWEPTGAGPHKAVLPVGAFPAGHAGGLWDLAGNVWEWCASAIDSRMSAEVDCPRLSAEEVTSVTTTPDNVMPGRVLRGGSWRNFAGNLRCAVRLRDHPVGRFPYIGFRVVVRVPPASGVDP